MIFTLFDIIILTIIAISSLSGLYRGIINITINLLGFIGSIIAAIFLYPYVRLLSSGYVDNDLVTSLASGITAYIISLIAFTFLASKIALLFDGSRKSIFDRSLGLIVGVIRGILCSLILFSIIAIFTTRTYIEAENIEDLIFHLSFDKYPEWLKNSITTLHLEKLLKSSPSTLPKEILHSVKIPWLKKNRDKNIIDAIKKRKSKDVKSFIER